MPIEGIWTNAEISTAYATWALAFFTAILCLSVALAWRQIRADHARSRRELAINLGAQWVEHQTERLAKALRLVNALDIENTKRVLRREPFYVDQQFPSTLRKIFPSHPKADGGHILLDAEQANELRWLVVNHLNQLETALLGWHYNVAEREIIESEFSYLVEQSEGDTIAEKFRANIESGAWPAIDAFVDHCRQKQKKISPGMDRPG